jgi:hypothetical protein
MPAPVPVIPRLCRCCNSSVPLHLCGAGTRMPVPVPVSMPVPVPVDAVLNSVSGACVCAAI